MRLYRKFHDWWRSKLTYRFTGSLFVRGIEYKFVKEPCKVLGFSDGDVYANIQFTNPGADQIFFICYNQRAARGIYYAKLDHIVKNPLIFLPIIAIWLVFMLKVMAFSLTRYDYIRIIGGVATYCSDTVALDILLFVLYTLFMAVGLSSYIYKCVIYLKWRWYW